MAEETIQQEETLEGGSYEVIRKRLIAQAQTLRSQTRKLNEHRKKTFGSTELTVIAQGQVRTQQNCVPRDIISLGDYLLVGYNVPRGLKKEMPVGDVLSIHRFSTEGDEIDFPEVGHEVLPGLLDDPRFIKDFGDLYRYYRDVRLAQLLKTETRIMAAFQVGERVEDLKTLVWSISGAGEINYVDNRGELKFPAAFDFRWKQSTREQQVFGEHPHINLEDLVFVETVGGDLTVKVDDNTGDGWGIYREPVDDPNQTLDDAEYFYAILGGLVLMKIKPYREEAYRHLVFNTRTEHVLRIDAMERACVQLPEEHGIIFPGGYYLQSGEYKVFDEDPEGLIFKRSVKSPNGEDVLYIFYDREQGSYVLLSYNLIRKEVENPIRCQGFSIFDNGHMVVFRAHGSASRRHPMQVWQTSYSSADFAASAPRDGSFLSNVGNADLVRGISDSLSVVRLIERPNPTRPIFEDIIGALIRMPDSYYWLAHPETGGIAETVQDMGRTAELIIDEFEKVLAFQARAKEALQEMEEGFMEVTRGVNPSHMSAVEEFMGSMTDLRQLRGQLISAKEIRYIDLERLDELEAESVSLFDEVSQGCVRFMLDQDALGPLNRDIREVLQQIERVLKTAEIEPLRGRTEALSKGLDLLSEVISNIQIEDPTARTQILEGIGETFGQLNRVRATLEGRRKELQSAEGRAEFSAQFKLFAQSVSSALSMCDSPERCDEELSRLMIQLQELEGRFSEFDEFLGDLASKRDDTYEAFSAKKQTLLDERNRRVGNIIKAADRILEGVVRRARRFKDATELNAYFASDSMILKLRQLSEQLASLGDSIKSEELLSKLKSSKQDAMRALRDQLDLFEGGGNLIKFGPHQFTVNTQALELTMVPREDEMVIHLTGSDFYEPVENQAFLATRPFWVQNIISEDPEVYRSEYLAASLLFAAEAGEQGLSEAKLQGILREGKLGALLKEKAQERYDEGYERGLHDEDATLILEKLISMRQSAGLLRFGPAPRALALLFWGAPGLKEEKEVWGRRARNLSRLKRSFGHHPALNELAQDLGRAITQFCTDSGFEALKLHSSLAGRYLQEELFRDQPRFTTSRDADALVKGLIKHLRAKGEINAFDADLKALELKERMELAVAWLEALVSKTEEPPAADLILEAAVILAGASLDRELSSAITEVEVKGLLGQHSRIKERRMKLRLDEFITRLSHFIEHQVPGFKRYRELRAEVIEEAKERLRLSEFMPRVMSSFVRNKLINDVYLSLIGDNFAKQMGAAGSQKRTDLMGLLLLISPPGYGKTTLMEYCANRLGLIFMKVNGPSLGHSVVSLDPREAPNATAIQEVNKINLALEMGNNVMLYLDDIQHCNPELLQKFISLCDAQRKIEGIWQGKTRTYDLRGKKFCVVMAGNPYTETGARFVIPDMLANRADTYNLGDVLEGRDEVFSLSYLENSLTSNPVLQPLAMREQSDIYNFIKMAQGIEVPSTDLKHGYSAVESNEIVEVFKRLLKVQEVVLKVNLQYIASAAVDEAFRTEPSFKLQGSYRNMNKMAEKVVTAMNEEELQALIDDHYNGEAQTLTSGSENNLIKLAQLRGRISEAQEARWEEIKRSFKRVQTMGAGGDDPMVRAVGALAGLGENLEAMRVSMEQNRGTAEAAEQIGAQLRNISEAMGEGSSTNKALGKLAAWLGGINKTLGQGAGSGLEQKVGSVAQQIAGLRKSISAPQSNQELLKELEGIREALKATGGVAPAAATARPGLSNLGKPGTRGWGAGAEPSSDQGLQRALTELSKSLKVLSQPQLEVKVAAPQGVEELLAQQVALVERTLVPVVQSITENGGDSRAILQRLTQVIQFLKQVDQRLKGRGL